MLKAVVEQVKLRSELRFGEAPGLVSIFADDYRHLQFACDQERLVAELLWKARGVDQVHTFGFSSVTARQDINLDPASLEQLAQKNYKRSFSRPSRGKIAHADDWALEPPRRQNSPVIKRVTRSDHATVNG